MKYFRCWIWLSISTCYNYGRILLREKKSFCYGGSRMWFWYRRIRVCSIVCIFNKSGVHRTRRASRQNIILMLILFHTSVWTMKASLAYCHL
jgi:hypothetical protein